MKFPTNVTVASIDIKPFFEFHRDGKTKPKGLEGRLLGILSQALGFEYQMASPKTREWGSRTTNGTWTGLIGMVLSGEADFAMCNIGYSEERQSAIDFSYPYTAVNLIFATNLPKLLPKELIYIYAFDTTTWVCLLVLLFFLSLVFNFLSSSKTSYIDHLLGVFGNILHQPTSDGVFYGRFLMGCWWFVSLVISVSFSTGLSSIMTIPFTEPTVRNFDELAVAVRQGDYRVFTMSGTNMIPTLYIAQKPHLTMIADLIVKNNWYAAPEEFLKKEFEPKTAMLGVSLMLNYWYGKAPLSTKFIAHDETVTTTIGVVITKQFCCKKELDHAIMKILEAGLYEKMVNDEFFMSWLKASKEGLEMGHDVPLSLNDASGAFALLICGCFISTLTFLGEIVYMRLRK